jgi:hypothetical protein
VLWSKAILEPSPFAKEQRMRLVLTLIAVGLAPWAVPPQDKGKNKVFGDDIRFCRPKKAPVDYDNNDGTNKVFTAVGCSDLNDDVRGWVMDNTNPAFLANGRTTVHPSATSMPPTTLWNIVFDGPNQLNLSPNLMLYVATVSNPNNFSFAPLMLVKNTDGKVPPTCGGDCILGFRKKPLVDDKVIIQAPTDGTILRKKDKQKIVVSGFSKGGVKDVFAVMISSDLAIPIVLGTNLRSGTEWIFEFASLPKSTGEFTILVISRGDAPVSDFTRIVVQD